MQRYRKALPGLGNILVQFGWRGSTSLVFAISWRSSALAGGLRVIPLGSVSLLGVPSPPLRTVWSIAWILVRSAKAAGGETAVEGVLE